MADFGALADAGPITSSRFQKALDLAVQFVAHTPILVKDSLKSKEHFTSGWAHPRRVPEKHINQVVADNLAYWMSEAKMTQMALAEKSGVSQKTISNYLNPDQRAEGSKGKPPSPKLTELDMIARALSVSVWQLTREMSASERKMYESIEDAYKRLRAEARSEVVVAEITDPLISEVSGGKSQSPVQKPKIGSALEKASEVGTGDLRNASSKSKQAQKPGTRRRA